MITCFKTDFNFFVVVLTNDVYFICFDRYRSGQLLSDPDVSVVVYTFWKFAKNFPKLKNIKF